MIAAGAIDSVARQIGARPAATLVVLLASVAAGGQPAATSKGAIPGDCVTLKAERAGHVLILNQVYLNAAGPFRMMIDTGNTSSLIRPGIASRLSLRPAFAVEQITIDGVRNVPVALLKEATIGPLTETDVEVMIGDIRTNGVDGVLGQSWLARHDYLLDYQNRRIVIDCFKPEEGVSIPLQSRDGRPVISVDVDGHARDLVLDSGVPLLALFECERSSALQNDANRMSLLTNRGSSRVSLTSVKITLPGDRTIQVPAACVENRDSGVHSEIGLLPASVFRAIFVSNHSSVVRLIH